MLSVTALGDPTLIFLLIAPTVYLLAKDRNSGVELLIALIASDWTNGMMKWAARGDRPYWHDDRVKEFSVTCESGFGMPSGHMMVSTAVSFLLIARISPRWRRTARSIAFIFLFLVGLSRMYVGAHFLGQVIAGTMIGAIEAFILIRYRVAEQFTRALEKQLHRARQHSTSFLLRISIFALLFAGALIFAAVIVFLLLSLASDPLASMQLAREGCEATKHLAAAALSPSDSTSSSPSSHAQLQAQWQLERGPFMGMIRDAGAAMGGIIGWACVVRYSTNNKTNRQHNDEEEREESGVNDHETDEMIPVTNGRPPSVAHSLTRCIPSSSARSVTYLIIRAASAIFLTALLRVLASIFFRLPPFPTLSASFPLSFVYTKNFIVFAWLAFGYLVLMPITLQWAERAIARIRHRR